MAKTTDRECDGGEYADYEGIHIKELLVPAHLTAPQGVGNMVWRAIIYHQPVRNSVPPT